jgi:hypothetical protein
MEAETRKRRIMIAYTVAAPALDRDQFHADRTDVSEFVVSHMASGVRNGPEERVDIIVS